MIFHQRLLEKEHIQYRMLNKRRESMKKPIFNLMQYIMGAKFWDFVPVIKPRIWFYKKGLTSIGNNVSFGCHLDFACPHGSKMQRISISDNVVIARNTIIEMCSDIDIKEGVTISENVAIFRHKHIEEINKSVEEWEIEWSKKLTIAQNSWIGYNVTILPKVNYIGENVIIAAGAVVTKDIEDNAIVAGNPAKIIRYRDK